jgi:ribosome maturation factor RimP
VGASPLFLWQKLMATTAVLSAEIESKIKDLGFELVRLNVNQGKNHAVLQIMAEPLDLSPMTIQGCEQISRFLSPWLEVVDPITSAYTLEVSSPGIDRPLTKLPHFARWAGHEAKVELAHPVPELGSTRKNWRGILKGIEGETVLLEMLPSDAWQGTAQLPFIAIRSAKLMLTEALLLQSAPQDILPQETLPETLQDALLQSAEQPVTTS